MASTVSRDDVSHSMAGKGVNYASVTMAMIIYNWLFELSIVQESQIFARWQENNRQGQSVKEGPD